MKGSAEELAGRARLRGAQQAAIYSERAAEQATAQRGGYVQRSHVLLVEAHTVSRNSEGFGHATGSMFRIAARWQNGTAECPPAFNGTKPVIAVFTDSEGLI